jgi:16S rRNA C967 or C1407 C5-methylase (RsmB/RsmF family)
VVVTPPAHLERYAPIVEDASAFFAASARPLPRVVWANPLKGDVAEVIAALRTRCPDAVPLKWDPAALKLPSTAKPGRWPEYALGLAHAQEEAAMWAVRALDVLPGQRIVDLCAAPGNKTAQIAALMQNRGMVVANEHATARLASLRFNLDRLGVSCAVVMRHDAAVVPGADGEADAVLADVPCSCEGTSRKHLRAPSPRFRATVVQVQTAILRRALRLVKPGGVVVYSTCTYAPEENEGVLSAISPELARVEPFSPPSGFVTRPGLVSWGESTFREDAVHAHRIWPHDNDTGGFFVAKLRRV